jgi:hypothetical protein
VESLASASMIALSDTVRIVEGDQYVSTGSAKPNVATVGVAVSASTTGASINVPTVNELKSISLSAVLRSRDLATGSVTTPTVKRKQKKRKQDSDSESSQESE